MAHCYELVEVSPGRWTVELGADADVLRTLTMAPDEIEPDLRSGRWLILAFALWSAPDHRAIGTPQRWSVRRLHK